MKTLISLPITFVVFLMQIAQVSAAHPPAPYQPVEEAHKANPIPISWDHYGHEVAISGDRFVTTSHNRAALFIREDGNWRYQGNLTGPPNTHGILSAALEGDTLVLGDGFLNSEKGAAYVFTRSNDLGRNAWNVTSKERTIHYSVDLTSAQHQAAQANGWRYLLDARFPDSYYSGWPVEQPSAMHFLYGDGSKRYGVYLRVNAAGDLVARLMGATPEDHVLTTQGVGAADYHAHELAFDHLESEVTYFFDGEPVHTWSGDGGSTDGIFWGSDSASADGSMNVHEARFEILQTGEVPARYHAGMEGNPVIAPDPADHGWTLYDSQALIYPLSVGPQSPDPATVWRLQATLAGDGANSDAFGKTLALHESTLVVGAPGEKDDGGATTGAAYVFIRVGNEWERQQKLIPSLSGDRDDYGWAVDIDGETILVGAPRRNLSHLDLPGRAFVFVRNGAIWTEQAMLFASDSASSNQFGDAVAVDGDRAAVGAGNTAHGATSHVGAAFIFARSGDAWTEAAKLTPDPVVGGGHFGYKLDLHGDHLLVGAYRTPAFYLFKDAGEAWHQIDSLIYPNPENSRVIGEVAFDGAGDRFVVGLFGFSEHEALAGAFIYGMYSQPSVAFVEYLNKLLYYPDAAASPGGEPDKAAFRYKHLLYGDDGTGIRANHDAMDGFYGPAERALSEETEAMLREGLTYFPDDPVYGNLLLDIHYDRAQAEAILAKNLAGEAEKARIGPPLGPPAPIGGFIIDNEIPIHRQVLEAGEVALRGYFSLMKDDLGVPGDPPLGYRIFRDLVPERGLAAAIYMDSMGNSFPVTTEPALFAGYKDLTLLFNLLRDYGRSAGTLGRLLVARKAPGDMDEANALLARCERFLFLQGNLLLGMYEFEDLPAAGDPSGLVESIQAWGGSMETLADLRQTITGRANILGFSPDFLMLIQTFDEIHDSFDAFKERLGSVNSPLDLAKAKLATARESHGQFLGYQSQYLDEFGQMTSSYHDRLFQIVGALPGAENYSDDPRTNAGSELHQQYLSIQVARQRIARNTAEIDNLAKEAQIEINRAADVSGVMIKYGDKQAKLTEQIGHIQAAQAAADRMANSIDFSAGPQVMFAKLAVGAVNSAVQAGGEVKASQLEGQKDKLAADEKAEIVGLDSTARVKTLLLGMRTLTIDSMTASLLFQQEIARMSALYREKAYLEARVAEASESLAARHFADPVHRLTAESGVVEANLYFAEAQRWLFYMVRALEYKWNQPFANIVYPSPGGRMWATDTLFKLRNADELDAFYHAMVEFDTNTLEPQLHSSFFSLRRHAMGLQVRDAPYVDPETGEERDAIAMFRTILERSRGTPPGPEMVLEFNTVREIDGNFFLGPAFTTHPDGSRELDPLRPGRFLNKIDYLQVFLAGPPDVDHVVVYGSLSYGGTSFVRNFEVGTIDPAQPDRLINEMTAYSTRFWYRHLGRQRWEFREDVHVDAVPIQLTTERNISPDPSLKIMAFKERSVAATGWKLIIPLFKNGIQVVFPEQLDDIEIHFYHFSRQRQ